jgi:hypothetical protein
MVASSRTSEEGVVVVSSATDLNAEVREERRVFVQNHYVNCETLS